MADHAFARQLVDQWQAQPAARVHDLPAYDGEAAAALATHSRPASFRLGTGASVFSSALLPAIRAARREVILVTCFWAPSPSLRGLSETLAQLAAATRTPESPPLRIRIGLSSRSALQKLLHTGSRAGYVYPPATWSAQLGLPPADVLQAGGIDLQVKSLFFRPFSVMHPKLVIVDRARAFLPSCNVSWEDWLECCVELTGDAVQPLLAFYAQTWGDDLPDLPDLPPLDDGDNANNVDGVDDEGPTDSPSLVVRFPGTPVPTVVLPSSHHCNPHFRLLPWLAASPPPPTPLNLALLQLFAAARRHIYAQTPNLTSEPAIAALLAALARGVDVTVVTSRAMMVLEQLVTAGTTTAWRLASLVSRYEAIRRAGQPCGRLTISYFVPLRPSAHHPARPADEEQAILPSPASVAEPVHSHVKLTIVDGLHTVLGSGNLDRASWYTSQELGILFHDAAFAAQVRAAVDRVLEGRLAVYYDAQ